MSAYDVIECPSDPCDAARERIRDLLTREPMPDPRDKPFDPRKSVAVSFILPFVGLLTFVGACFWLASKLPA